MSLYSFAYAVYSTETTNNTYIQKLSALEEKSIEIEQLDIKFRNVKTNQETIKDISELAGKISKAYNIASFKDMFREVYKGEEMSDDRFALKNPASSNPTSSTFK